jgi:hypothetical protein
MLPKLLNEYQRITSFRIFDKSLLLNLTANGAVVGTNLKKHCQVVNIFPSTPLFLRKIGKRGRLLKSVVELSEKGPFYLFCVFAPMLMLLLNPIGPIVPCHAPRYVTVTFYMKISISQT